MENKSRIGVLVLPLVVFGWMLDSSAKAKASEHFGLDTYCSLAIAAALDDLEALYERHTDWDSTTFHRYIWERIEIIECGPESEGLRVEISVEDSRFPGDTVRYLIDKRSRFIIERVIQR